MRVKNKAAPIYNALVVLAIVDTLWKWRKLFFWAAGVLFVSYRLLFVAASIAIAIYAALSPSVVLAQPQYPGGVRDASQWYYCHALTQNAHASTAAGAPTVTTCEHILWQPDAGGGGGHHTVSIEAGVQASDSENDGDYANVDAWILPADEIKSYTMACEGIVQACRTSGGTASAGASFATNNAAGFAINAFSIGVGHPATVGMCNTQTLNVVTTFDKSTSNAWSTAGAFPTIKTVANTINNRVGTNAFGSCVVTSYTNRAGQTPWFPDIGDLVPEPTPTPDVIMIPWIPDPWIPITNPVSSPDFEFTGPGETECYRIVPGQSIDWDGETYGWPNYDLCIEPFSMTLKFFGFDIAAYLNVALAYCALVIIYGMIKAGG